MFSVVVGTLGATAEDDMDILVTAGLYDGGETLLGDTHEGVRVRCRFHGIYCDTDAPIGSYMRCDKRE